jgi:hypothetical protein
MQERFGLDVAPHERKPIGWYAPAGLWRIAREQLWSLNLLRNLDRRETFTLPLQCIDLRDQAEPEGPDSNFWIDFIADTGDGSNATTAVAQGLLATRLVAAGLGPEHAAGLPTGRLLLLGGDLAYPGASPQHYQARLVEPFELARPTSRLDPDKIIAAIPQNHDWMDSLSTFCRYFVNDRKAGLLGAEAPQKRSYFAITLPHGWTVLGFDFALAGDIDRGQYDAFLALLDSGAIAAGTRLLLVYPEPYWTRPLGDRSAAAYPKRYQRLEERLMRAGCEIRLRLAGDLHHYVRESLPAAALGYPSELVTCGTGGAFGHPTHSRETRARKYLLRGLDAQAAQEDVRARAFVGRAPAGQAPTPGPHEQLHAFAQAKHCWPDPRTSRRRAWLNTVALLRPANLGFALGIGSALWAGSLVVGPWCLLGLLPAGLAAILVATENDPAHAGKGEWLLALLLLLAQPALLAALRVVESPALRWPVAVLATALLFGSFLALASALLGRLPNNASSALPGEREKGFLRLRVHPGGIEAFMLGLDDVPRRWRRNPEGWPWWVPMAREDALRWRVVDRFEMPAGRC